ncbi:MAG: hypothetical protein Q9201_007537 [Fulgogasparrea decipioides]
MRGLSKAAILLSSVYASASADPQSREEESAKVSDYILKYNESEASVVFQIAEPIAPGVAIPPLKFRVGSTLEPCGESNLRLDGQKLPLEWDGGHGLGSDFLDAFRFLPNIFTTWYISCLDGASSSTSEGPNGRDPIQVAQFGIYNHNRDRTEAAGFAVSFRSTNPEILRLVPVWTEYSDIVASPEVWRTSSIAVPRSSFDPEFQSSAQDFEQSERFFSLRKSQKSLKAHLGQVQNLLGTTFERARQTFQSWCYTHKQSQTSLGTSREDTAYLVHSQSDNTVSPTSEASGTNPHALPTRSASPDLAFTNPTSEDWNYTGLKVFGLVLILSSLSIWVFLRLRDPRLRADRAARREERRNKRLYRQAARQHEWKRWFCSWRHRGHRCTPVGTWDEKRVRVLQQEEILEEVMKEDIRKIRDRHRAENHIDAAERGRSIYAYDSDDSRRRSRETLPGYESEGTQPPSYDVDVNGSVTRVADGFRYTPADREDTPESSVISTSPRTSRDDRDSEFGRDFEPLSLGTTVVAV